MQCVARYLTIFTSYKFTLWCVQTDYEQELALQRTAHKRELARSKDEVAQLLATAEATSIPVDEELVRRRYMKEIERIKVCDEMRQIFFKPNLESPGCQTE